MDKKVDFGILLLSGGPVLKFPGRSVLGYLKFSSVIECKFLVISVGRFISWSVGLSKGEGRFRHSKLVSVHVNSLWYGFLYNF